MAIHANDSCNVSLSSIGISNLVGIILPRETVVSGKSLVELWKLRKVVIPDGVERIGNYWFWGSCIESVWIPASVQEIGIEAFYDCKKLKKLIFRKSSARKSSTSFLSQPDSSQLRAIRTRAFYRCSSLATIDFPNSIEEIGIGAFRATGLESAMIPPSTRIIHQGAFSWCRNLQKVVMSNGLETLGTVECFSGGADSGIFEESAVKYISLPATLKIIEHSVFRNCKNLRHIQLPDGLMMIGLYAFSGSGLENVITPESVRIICQGAFSDC